MIQLSKVSVVVPMMALGGLSWLAVATAPMVSASWPVDPVSIGLFLGVWVVGMYAMMVPSVLPLISLLSLGDEDGKSLSRTSYASKATQFLIGYLGGWSLFGLAVFSLLLVGSSIVPRLGALGGLGGFGSGVAVALGGAYQLGPLKSAALGKCRSPSTFLLTSIRTGKLAGLRMGAAYSVFCAECCWALMAVLVFVGAMSIVWMLVFAAAVFAEKVLPRGELASKVIGVLLLATGAGVALSASIN